MSTALPTVTIVMPVLDEAQVLEEVLSTIASQDYAGPWEVVIADGGSTDGSRDILRDWTARHSTWRLVDNPRRRQSHGVNLAVAEATGEVIVRMDAHTVYAPDYVSRSVEALVSSGATAVGGPMRPRGTSVFGRAVAAAMSSPLTTGPGAFHRDGAAGSVDTVYLGAFRRSDFAGIGGLRSFPSGAGEDADLFHRWRRAGGTVVLDPAIRSQYRPRSTAKALLLQHVRYGRAKGELLWANGRFPSWRPLAPALLLLLLAFGLVVWLVGGVSWPLVAIVAAWILVLAGASLKSPRLIAPIMAAGGLMHLGYGIGLWWALLRGPGAVRRSLGGGAPDG